jgi:hypothetical protein
MPDFPIVPYTLDKLAPSWWVKIVGMLQQNWALPVSLQGRPTLLFVGDTGGMFDRIDFDDEASMRLALVRNGFKEFSAHDDLQIFIVPPEFPLDVKLHPGGFIYSSGEFWA